MPQFWNTIASAYNAASAHQFLLHFNINDLAYDEVYDYLPMRYYLMEQLNVIGCDFVFGYNPSEGIIWPNVNWWKSAQNSLGLAQRLSEKEAEEKAKSNARPEVNSRVVHSELHKDEFLNSKPVPNDELRRNLDRILHQGRAKIGLVIDFVEKIVPNAEPSGLDENQRLFLNTFQQWATDLDIRLQKHVVLFVTPNLADVHPALVENAAMPKIPVPFPRYAERLAFIEHLINLRPPEKPSERHKLNSQLTLPQGMTKEQLAKNTVGMNLVGLHNLALHAEVQPITAAFVQTQRRESVSHHSGGVLELISSPYPVDSVGGLAHVGNTLADIVAAVHERDLRRVPRGVLLLGQPGTGKTLVATLLGRHSDIAVVKLKARGEMTATNTKRRRDFSMAIHFIRSVAPLIVFIDNIELAGRFPGGVEPDGLFVELLDAMEDTTLKGDVVWLGASNRPDLIHPAFLRSGAFEEKLVFLYPTAAERADILAKLFKRHQVAAQGIDFAKVSADAHMQGFSSAALEQITRRSFSLAKRNNRNAVTEADLLQAIADYVPEHSPEMSEFMGLLALREANSRSMIPAQLPPEFQSYLDNNRLNKTQMDLRITELRRQLGVAVGHGV